MNVLIKQSIVLILLLGSALYLLRTADGGIMGNFTNYEYIPERKVSPEVFKMFQLDPIKYKYAVEIPTEESLPKTTIEQPVISEQIQPTVTPAVQEQSSETKSKLDKVIDFALSRAHKNSTHWCAKYVRQALESQGFKPGNSINGWEYERAAKNMGWKEVTDGSIKKGDLIVTKKHDGRGHVALATKDNADIFNDRTSSVSDFVSRGVPYSKNSVKNVRIFRAAKKGMKFAEYSFIQPERQFKKQDNKFGPFQDLTSRYLGPSAVTTFQNTDNSTAWTPDYVLTPYGLEETTSEKMSPKTTNFKYNGSSKEFFAQHQNDWFNFLKAKGLEDNDATRLSMFFTAQDGLESANGTSTAAKQNNFGGMQINGKNVAYNSKQEYFEKKYSMMNNKFPEALKAKTPE